MTLVGWVATASAQPCQSGWSALGPGLNSQINAVFAWDSDGAGAGPAVLLAGGIFTGAGTTPTSNIAIWNGTAWSGLGGGVSGTDSTVYAFATFDDDGSGPNPPSLFVGGRFTLAGTTAVHNLARWDGSAWQDVGGGTNAIIYAMTVFDDDGPGPNMPALYIGGEFTLVGGSVSAARVASWNGTSWSPLAGGIGGSVPFVSAFAVFDEDGDAPDPPRLFVAGDYDLADSITVNNIARWDGATWSPLLNGTSGFIDDLAVFDPDGTGPEPAALYAVGAYSFAGGVQVSGIGRWNGAFWSSVGGGLNAPAYALEVFDEDGAGPGLPALFAAGSFSLAGGNSASHVARWDGTTWSPLGSGISAPVVLDLVTFDRDGSGAGTAPATLICAGVFSSAGGIPASRIAQWRGCEAGLVTGDIDGDGDVDLDDLNFFIAVLLGVDSDPLHIAHSDLTGEGLANGADIQSLVNALLG